MRYAVLSDIHANLPAFEAVLEDIAAQQIERSLYLGDAVGYYADSAAVIDQLEKLLVPMLCSSDGQLVEVRPWVAGNHEWGLLGRIEAYQFSPVASLTLQQVRSELSGEKLALLAALPQRIEIDLGHGIQATIVHAAPNDPIGVSAYLENGEDAALAAQDFVTPICLVGHTHYPRILYESAMVMYGHTQWNVIDVFEEMLPGGCYQFGSERLIFNPGSVGQPRDGDSRASYAILDTVARTFTVRRVEYDIPTAQRRVRDWLPTASGELLDGKGGLAERLEHGI